MRIAHVKINLTKIQSLIDEHPQLVEQNQKNEKMLDVSIYLHDKPNKHGANVIIYLRPHFSRFTASLRNKLSKIGLAFGFVND